MGAHAGPRSRCYTTYSVAERVASSGTRMFHGQPLRPALHWKQLLWGHAVPPGGGGQRRATCRAADSVLRDSPPSESRTPTCSCAVLRLLRRLCVSVASGLGGPPASPLHCPRASLHVRAPESSADTSELARGAHGPAHGVRARTASHSEPSMLPEGCCGFATVGHGAKNPGVTARPG